MVTNQSPSNRLSKQARMDIEFRADVARKCIPRKLRCGRSD